MNGEAAIRARPRDRINASKWLLQQGRAFLCQAGGSTGGGIQPVHLSRHVGVLHDHDKVLSIMGERVMRYRHGVVRDSCPVPGAQIDGEQPGSSTNIPADIEGPLVRAPHWGQVPKAISLLAEE
jgi:hypothetical protein